MNAYSIHNQISSGELTAEDFHKLMEATQEKIKANCRLSNLLNEQRYENVNRMAKSYMEEFAKRQLVYVPVVDEKHTAEMMVKIAHEILKQYSSLGLSTKDTHVTDKSKIQIKGGDLKYIK